MSEPAAFTQAALNTARQQVLSGTFDHALRTLNAALPENQQHPFLRMQEAKVASGDSGATLLLPTSLHCLLSTEQTVSVVEAFAQHSTPNAWKEWCTAQAKEILIWTSCFPDLQREQLYAFMVRYDNLPEHDAAPELTKATSFFTFLAHDQELKPYQQLPTIKIPSLQYLATVLTLCPDIVERVAGDDLWKRIQTAYAPFLPGFSVNDAYMQALESCFEKDAYQTGQQQQMIKQNTDTAVTLAHQFFGKMSSAAAQDRTTVFTSLQPHLSSDPINYHHFNRYQAEHEHSGALADWLLSAATCKPALLFKLVEACASVTPQHLQLAKHSQFKGEIPNDTAPRQTNAGDGMMLRFPGQVKDR